MKDLKEYIIGLNPNISKENVKKILSISSLIKCKKGKVIIDKEYIAKDVFFIKKGFVRKYVVDENGKEFIREFYKDLELFAPAVSLISQSKNEYLFDCLKDCVLFTINYQNYVDLCKQDHQVAISNTRIVERALLSREKRITELTMLDGTERYLKLRQDYPGIEKHVAQYHIAHYLNITPVQLSRIRKKLFAN